MFTKLYLKDLHEVTVEILIVVIGVALVTAGFLLSSDQKAPLLIFPLILLLGLAGFLPLISSFKLLSREWSQNTVYLVMSLPVSGAMILGAKMAVLLTQYIGGTLLIALSSYLLYVTKLSQFLTPQQQGLMMLYNHPQLFQSLLAFYVSGLVFLTFLCCTSFFSQIAGKLSAKFSGLVTAVTFIITLILSGKILDALGTGSNELYHMMIQISGDTANYISNMNMSSLSYLVLAILLFILAAVIYDRKLEL
jgi:hypothetical protein